MNTQQQKQINNKKQHLPISNVQASAQRLKITWVGGYCEQWQVRGGVAHKMNSPFADSVEYHQSFGGK